MPIKFLKENLKKTILLVNCLIFVFTSYLLAADKVGKDKADELTGLKQEARFYRSEGLRLQGLGDLDSALKLYQKAVEIDPEYAEVYNDLGIIYEAQGEPDRAEDSYIKALEIDPYFLSPYSNLALFYEGKRDLANAAFYWGKRVELGSMDDPWTLKAKQRLEDVRLSLSRDPMMNKRNNDVVILMREVINNKYARKNNEGVASRKTEGSQTDNYMKDNTKAIKAALDANYSDFTTKEFRALDKKTQ